MVCKTIWMVLVMIICQTVSMAQNTWTIVIHGGAGVIQEDRMTQQRQQEYRNVMEQALSAGKKMADDGARAVDIVPEVIRIMEDSPLFNAGKGAVYTHEGKIELDASIMEGAQMKAGAVTGITDIKNPILAAKEVMLHSSHVFLSGKGASDNDYVERLMFCVVNMDISGFKKLAGDIIENMGIEEAVPKIFFRLFVRIGTYWQVGSVFPAQEHIITHIYRQKLIASIDTLNVPEKKGKTILFFLAEEEMHELSLLYYSYLGGKLGYEVVYLGQSVPFEDLKRIRTQMSIDYVFTAFIKPMEKGVLETYLEDLKQVFDSQKIFITGGQIEFHNPHLPRGVKIVKDNREFRKYLH